VRRENVTLLLKWSPVGGAPSSWDRVQYKAKRPLVKFLYWR